MAGKLKKLDLKGMAIRHGEKVVFGLVAFFSAFMLFGADWMPFGLHPQEVTNKVLEGEDKLKRRTWPEEEQTAFVVEEQQKVENLVNNMLTHVDPSPYLFTQDFAFDLYGTTAPITEPEFLPVENLIADVGRFTMYVHEEREEPSGLLAQEITDATVVDESGEDESEIPEEFRSRDGATGLRGDRLGGKGKEGRDVASALESLRGGGIGIFGSDDDDDDYAESGAGGAGREYGRETGAGRGQRYVAVRGIVPLHEQLLKIKKASHVSRSDAEALYDIMEFELQRKRMLPDAEDPWSGEWEPADVEFSTGVLLESPGFDPEVVEGIVTDIAITMPLPQRVIGFWGKDATHPALENFALTDEEMELEMEIYSRLLKKHQEQAGDEPEEIVAKGGFSKLMSGNSRRLAGAVDRKASDDTQVRSYPLGIGDDEDDDTGGRRNRGILGAYNAGPSISQTDFLAEFEDVPEDDLRNKLQEYVKERITASGQLLLFRYFDFDVEPGASYMYRVRLEVTNPNYNRSPSEAKGLDYVVEGQTRKTDWSNITDAVHVPRDADYFVASIDEPRGASLSSANFSIFKWDPEIGTTVETRSLDVELGSEIGGREETHVLDAAKARFEIEDYNFQTGDVLVDAFRNDKIRSTQHEDLNLATGRDLGLSNQVLVLQGDGRLVVLDEVTRKDELAERRKYFEYEQKDYQDIKDLEVRGPDTRVAGQNGGIFGGDDDDDDYYGTGDTSRDRRRGRGGMNPLQRARTNSKGKNDR
ncbi:MAG: hypothetical protein KDA93_07990 [Planctomycetaceae bacterium]|nr:hypothetical protein [Planctomycetaceae bacterium]